MWQLIPTVNSWNSLLPFGFPLSITEKTATSYLAKWSNPAISMISKHRIDLCYPQGYARGLRIHHLRVQLGIWSQPPSPARDSHARRRPTSRRSPPSHSPAMAEEHLDIPTLETWLWDAACAIRGAADAPKFKDFILPLVFFKRLSDVFDDEFAGQVAEFGDEEVAREVIKADHEDALKNNRKPIVRFFIPHEYRWDAVRHHAADGTLGQFVTDAMRDVAKHNPELLGVLDIKDYNERQSGQRTLDDDRLAALIEVVSRHRLGLKNAEPDILGRAYEYLLRKFAEGQGQSAGEFYTPKEVGWLMAHLLDPKPYTTVYDPTCGSAGLLIKARLLFEQKNPAQKSKAPKLYGQEMNPVTFAMAKMNMFLHDYTDSLFAIGDTFTKPGFAAEGAGLKRFDYVVANPMWNQDNYGESLYENDQWKRLSWAPLPRPRRTGDGCNISRPR